MFKLLKKLRKISAFNLIITVCFVLLIGMVSVLFGYGLCNKGLIISNAKQNVGAYYLVEMASCDDYNKALEIAEKIKEDGGAGFIRYDKTYHVFSSGYVSKKNAESVCKNNSNYSCSIYTLGIKDYSENKDFNSKLNKTIKNNVVVMKNVITALNSMIVEFDKDNKTEIDVKKYCLLLQDEINEQIDNFLDNFTQSKTTYRYKNYLLTFQSNIAKIVNLDATGSDFSRIVRYQELSCMFLFKDIMNTI